MSDDEDETETEVNVNENAVNENIDNKNEITDPMDDVVKDDAVKNDEANSDNDTKNVVDNDKSTEEDDNNDSQDDPKKESDESKEDDEDSNSKEFELSDFKLSDGSELQAVSPEFGEKFMTLAKEQGLTKGQVQSLVQYQEELYAESSAQQMAALHAQHAENQKLWNEELAKIPNIDVVTNKAQKAISYFDSNYFKDDTALRELLVEEGAPFANHPRMTKMFAAIADFVCEDEIISSDKRGKINNEDGLAGMFGHMNG
ncbi:hypothetical protein AAEX28_04690 [Lentisphaerota bacterium WC36G]|nr:hypothetical protein LJT99_07550 [Lentisphaerae bacterium WC36]